MQPTVSVQWADRLSNHRDGRFAQAAGEGKYLALVVPVVATPSIGNPTLVSGSGVRVLLDDSAPRRRVSVRVTTGSTARSRAPGPLATRESDTYTRPVLRVGQVT